MSRQNPTPELVSRGAPISSRPTLAIRFILLAMRIAGNLVTPFHPQLPDRLPGRLRFGGEMVLNIAFALLTVWLLGILGLHKIGDLVHMLLLVGLMRFLLGALKARDAAAVRGRGVDSAKP